MLASWAIFAALPAGAETLPEKFDKARPALQRQLRGRTVDARLEALDKLRQYPVAEAVRLVHSSFADSDEQVRSMAYAALLSMNGEQQVCDTLVELAEQGMREESAPRMVPPALAALLASNLPIAQINTRHFLDTTLAASPWGPQITLAIADSLAARGRPDDVVTLARLSKTKLFADHFAVRRAVVGALAEIRSKDAVATLIGMLDRVGGEAKADATKHLGKVTGQIFGSDAVAWQTWWAAAGEAFQYADGSPNAMHLHVVTEGESGQYYGLPLFAERLVFVLDTSGSMTGPRLVAAKRELTRAIRDLPDYVHFGVVVFNGRVRAWQRKLVPADAKMKKTALEFVERQLAQSNTASYDALETALAYDTEAVYFLSDGAPTAGKIVAPVDIIAAITAVNQLRRVSIYTIGIAPGFPGSPTDVFLDTLAQRNLGQYRRVDE